jgi:superfamily II DNA or RNA helicase
MNNFDLTFITNQKNQTLSDRFNVLIKNTRYFDVLVGFFYTSGFHKIYQSLENTENIRILIGINTDKLTFDLIQRANDTSSNLKPFSAQQTLQFSHAEAKEEYSKEITEEMENSTDKKEVEEGIYKFMEWLRSGKLKIRAYPSQNIHAKLYIMTFVEGDRDIGRVITGSSNFTKSGLSDNLEFNVELKNRSDYEFAINEFDKLWENSVDLKDVYINTIRNKTWLNQDVTPYQLYLKFLYEYFKDELGQTDEIIAQYYPEEFMQLEYQEQAVLNAKKILMEYGGVFISDVVGLGKTYISAMLAGQLEGRTLVIAPPVLLEKSNPGSWINVFSDFRIPADFESLGKLDHLLARGTERYQNIIIDEAHRFRTETTISYEKLATICRGKRVILVTATPYNNTPKDVLSLLKLFQNSKKSTIPNLPNLESFFSRLEQRLKKLDRKKNYPHYIRTVRENAREIREKVLKYLMVRRTRSEIEKYFPKDIKQQKLKFPEVKKPIPLFYQLNDKEDAVFNKTISLITEKFKYARYMPLLYYQGELEIDQLEKQSQRNMGRFMKVLLVKRLESSFYAFRNSIERFIHSYEFFIKEFDQGKVYISKKHINKIFELLENDDDVAVQRLIDEGKAEKYDSKDFAPEFKKDLQNDYQILQEIKTLWTNVKRDPKLLTFLFELSSRQILKKNNLVIFTESKETADYLYDSIKKDYSQKVLCYNGGSNEAVRNQVIENFDARSREQKDEFRILVSTEVLSEGVNLHRCNTVINYDIPWNPTRMMQRVGRINRVDTKFDKIHTFNFFPTTQSNEQIKLKEAAEAKINAFLTLLGGDAELLTEGEPIGSHELFNRLISKKTLEGEDGLEESELKYLNIIKEIRDNDSSLFARIKHLPKKVRTAKQYQEFPESLLTYFRKGRIQKFFIVSPQTKARELDFISAAKILESSPSQSREKLLNTFYNLLDKNKEAFSYITTEEYSSSKTRGGRDSATNVIRIIKATLKNSQKLTEDQEQYLKNVLRKLEEGGIPKQTSKQTKKALESLNNELTNPFKVLAVLQKNISDKLLESHYAERNSNTSAKREVILSMFLTGGENGSKTS